LAFKDLTPDETKVYEYIRDNDFESIPWVTASAARALHMSEEDVYKALSELTKKIRDNIWIHYESGELHISAD
jgi:DNA-binding MurR/RpiR family transcriptional regulator